MAAKSISLQIRLILNNFLKKKRLKKKKQDKITDLGDFSGPKESHPMRKIPMADLLLKIQDEAEIAKKENILIRQAALSQLLEEDNRILDESIRKILAADDNEDEDL